jgi:hypothetical protein
MYRLLGYKEPPDCCPVGVAPDDADESRTKRLLTSSDGNFLFLYPGTCSAVVVALR